MKNVNYHKGWVSGYDARSIDIALAVSEVKGMIEDGQYCKDASDALDKFMEIVNSNVVPSNAVAE